MNKTILSIITIISFTTIYSQNLADLYQQVHSSVVVIQTLSNLSAGGGDKIKTNSEQGLGSGVLISDDGLIWTASHVVHTAEKVQVKFTDNEIYEAEILSTSPTADVALIKVKGSFQLKNKHVATIGNSDLVRIGEEIFVIGSPLGVEQSLSRGIVSGRIAKDNLKEDFLPVEFIQTDAAINQGNSGGPLFNMKGEVIAIASFILSKSGGFDGLGFGASSNVATKILMEQKNIWSGMEFVFLQNELADAFNIPQKGGLLVLSVASEGLGDRLGLKGGYINAVIEGSELLIGGDIILSIAGVKLNSDEALTQLRLKMVLFDNLDYDIVYLRNGKVEKVTIDN
ncbi:hypothetical protein KH5_14070 [Urechidicola sp. KH5]